MNKLIALSLALCLLGTGCVQQWRMLAEPANQSAALQSCTSWEPRVEAKVEEELHPQLCLSSLGNSSSVSKIRLCNYEKVPVTVSYLICRSDGCSQLRVQGEVVPPEGCMVAKGEVCDDYKSVYVKEMNFTPSAITKCY